MSDMKKPQSKTVDILIIRKSIKGFTTSRHVVARGLTGMAQCDEPRDLVVFLTIGLFDLFY